MSAPRRHDLSCVVHVHSTYSDGTATVPEIVAAAAEAGRDAVLLTDHDTLQAKRDGWEGWHGGLLVLVGVEISPRGGHYLAFGLDEEVDHRRIPEAAIPAVVSARGGFGFAAHPFSRGSAMSKAIGRPHPWARLRDPQLGGIEVWSLATDSAESWRSPLEAIRFLRDPEARLTGPPPGNLRSWDALLSVRPTVAVGGLDAHQTGIRFRGRVRSPMPNREWFRMLGTHLLLDREPARDLAVDRQLAYAALRRGRCYVSRDSLRDPRGFAFWAEGGEGLLEMGDDAPAGDWELRASLPHPARITLLRNGEEVSRRDGDRLAHRAEAPGAYRVAARIEAMGKPRTWILSNAIRIQDPSEPRADG